MKAEVKWSNKDTVWMDTYLLVPNSESTSKEADDRLRLALEKDGLNVPLSVYLNDNEEYIVIMGNRRLRALSDMGYYKVPVNVFSTIKEAEDFGMMVRKISKGIK